MMKSALGAGKAVLPENCPMRLQRSHYRLRGVWGMVACDQPVQMHLGLDDFPSKLAVIFQVTTHFGMRS